MVPDAFSDPAVRPPRPRDMRVSSQALADVRHLLVTVENPESSTNSHLDFERCSALHNAIVKHGWVASGHDIADLQGMYEWPPSDGLFLPKAQERLHPDVIEMLKRCIDPGPEGGTFFRFLEGMPKDEAWWEWTEGFDEDWIQLYMASLDTSDTGVAVVYDQSDHSVKYVGSCHHEGLVESPAKWQRLETMLSAWVDLIERGKVVALDPTVRREMHERIVGDDLRTEDSAPFDQRTLGATELMSQSDPWETAMWTKQDLQDTLHAWHTLIEAIHERMPNIKSPLFVSKGLFRTETLLAAGIRKNSFAWHFLRNAHRPTFDYIGPSLKLATDDDLTNSVWKTARDDFKPTPWHPSIKPVHEPGPFPVPLLLGTSPAKNWHSRHPNSAFAAIDTVPWGLYFDDTGYDALLTEDACRLVLPYDLGGEGFAVRADGSKLGHKYVQGWAELYQLGQHPLVPCHGTQMFQVLEVWRACVREGVWKVGEEGVDEGAEKFRDADTEGWNEGYVVSFYDMRSRD